MRFVLSCKGSKKFIIAYYFQQNIYIKSAILRWQTYFYVRKDKMNVTIETSGELVIAYLVGEIDHHSASEIRSKLDNTISLRRPKHLIIDFKNVSFMDSSGIGLVMGRYRLLQSYKSTLELRNVSPQTKKLFELAGIGNIAIIKEI